MEFSAEKSFEKSFFQQIPRNFPRKITFRRKQCTKIRPLVTLCPKHDVLVCLFGRSAIILQSGRPDEVAKKSPKMSPKPFLANTHYRGKQQ
jgi:hypothetical protein